MELITNLTQSLNSLKEYFALDYANVETFTLTGTNKTMTKRGAFFNNTFYSTGGGGVKIVINDKDIITMNLGQSARPEIYIPVEIGDTIKYTILSGDLDHTLLNFVPYMVQN